MDYPLAAIETGRPGFRILEAMILALGLSRSRCANLLTGNYCLNLHL